MTDKRFEFGDSVNLIIDNTNNHSYGAYDVSDLINILNELYEENKSLKEENKFLRNKVATYKSGNALLKKTLDEHNEPNWDCKEYWND